MLPEHLGEQVLVCLCTGRRDRRRYYLAAAAGHRNVRLVSEMAAEVGPVDQRGFRVRLALQLLIWSRKLAWTAATAAQRRARLGRRRWLLVLWRRVVLRVQPLHVLLYREWRLRSIFFPHHQVDRGRSLNQGAVDVDRPFL